MDPRSALTFLFRAAVTSVLVSAVVAFVFLGVLPRTGAYRTLTVLSGSMRPAFAPGDMVVAKPVSTDQVKLGDILVYQIPVGDHHVESHRIVQILERTPNLVVRTKGDANDTADPWTAVLQGDRVWTVRRAVPYVGQAIVWFRSPLQHKATTFMLPGVIALLFLRTIWRRRPEEANVLQIG